jgi:hypothetical protein
MKKLLEKLFAKAAEPIQVKTLATNVQAAVVAKPVEFIGAREGYVFFIFFPEYHEMAPFLSENGQASLIRDLTATIKHSLKGLLFLVDLRDFSRVTIAIDDSPKQTPQIVTDRLTALDKDLLTWIGTFGKIGVPPIKYKIGAARGPLTIGSTHPKIVGHAVADALELATKFCVDFNLRICAFGDLIRASGDSGKWLDIDDWRFRRESHDIQIAAEAKAQKVEKVVRIFTKLMDRLEPEELQLLKDARKAYFHQNWDTAEARFDRLTNIYSLRTLAEKYIARIAVLRTRPLDPNWDGVFRE